MSRQSLTISGRSRAPISGRSRPISRRILPPHVDPLTPREVRIASRAGEKVQPRLTQQRTAQRARAARAALLRATGGCRRASPRLRTFTPLRTSPRHRAPCPRTLTSPRRLPRNRSRRKLMRVQMSPRRRRPHRLLAPRLSRPSCGSRARSVRGALSCTAGGCGGNSARLARPRERVIGTLCRRTDASTARCPSCVASSLTRSPMAPPDPRRPRLSVRLRRASWRNATRTRDRRWRRGPAPAAPEAAPRHRSRIRRPCDRRRARRRAAAAVMRRDRSEQRSYRWARGSRSTGRERAQTMVNGTRAR